MIGHGPHSGLMDILLRSDKCQVGKMNNVDRFQFILMNLIVFIGIHSVPSAQLDVVSATSAEWYT